MPQPDVVAHLARLVAFDTQNPPGREADSAAFVADALAALGCAVERQDYAPGRVNVIGRLVNGPGPVFAFNTHMDVVPAGDGWSGDPFALRADGGRLIARGACDAKGALAAMLAAIAALGAARERWSGTLLGCFVADEEVASNGARHFAATAPKIDYVVVASRAAMRRSSRTKAACARWCASPAAPRTRALPIAD